MTPFFTNAPRDVTFVGGDPEVLREVQERLYCDACGKELQAVRPGKWQHIGECKPIPESSQEWPPERMKITDLCERMTNKEWHDYLDELSEIGKLREQVTEFQRSVSWLAVRNQKFIKRNRLLEKRFAAAVKALRRISRGALNAFDIADNALARIKRET